MMNLYASVESDRACKGQGGNDFININISDKQKDHVVGLSFIRVIGTEDIVLIIQNSPPKMFKKHCSGYYQTEIDNNARLYLKEIGVNI